MCLVVVLHRVRADLPLVVAANRDERLDRPADGMTVLREQDPRVIGGRDRLAGGTWLATSERGTVGALTNLPLAGRDPGRRSRGELPLRLVARGTAAEGVAALVAEARPEAYNPAWLLCADRESAWYLDWTGAGAAVPVALPPGVHVLENHPIDAPTPKTEAVRAAVTPLLGLPADALAAALFAVLGSHAVPHGPSLRRPVETLSNCVHLGPYGTRTATVVRVGEGRPRVDWTDGPPCVTVPTAAGWGAG